MRSLLFYFFVALVPWQTVWIVREVWIDGEKAQYATIGILLSSLVAMSLLIFEWRILVRWWCAFRYQWWVIAFVIALVVQSFFVEDPLLFGYRAGTLILGFLLVVVMRARVYNLRMICIVLSLSMIGHVVLAVVQVATQYSIPSTIMGMAAHDPALGGVSVIETQDGRWLRAYGGFSHPNILGGTMAMMSILTLVGLVLYGYSQAMRRFFLLSGIFFACGMALSFSRAALVSYSFGLVSVLCVVFVFWRHLRAPIVAAVTAQCVMIVCIFVLLQELFIVRIDTTARLEVRSLDERTRYVQEAWGVITTYPLMGVGLGQYIQHIYHVDESAQPIWHYQPVHSSPLLFFAEMGIVGIILFGGCGMLFVRVMQGRAIIAPGYVMLVAVPLDVLIMNSFFDHWQWQSMFGILLIFLISGMIFVSHKGKDSTL